MKKKSVKKACAVFKSEVQGIDGFLAEIKVLSDLGVSWSFDYAIIRLYRSFEDFVLSCLVAAINNDTAQVSSTTHVTFPKHLTDEVCEYIIVGNGYFDFKGRDGLIKTARRFVPEDHYFVTAVKKPKYKDSLEKLSALRNFAAHDSQPSKARALESIGAKKMSSSGAWLKKNNRFRSVTDKLTELADEIGDAAPY